MHKNNHVWKSRMSSAIWEKSAKENWNKVSAAPRLRKLSVLFTVQCGYWVCITVKDHAR